MMCIKKTASESIKKNTGVFLYSTKEGASRLYQIMQFKYFDNQSIKNIIINNVIRHLPFSSINSCTHTDQLNLCFII